MASRRTQRLVEIEEFGDVTLVKFKVREVLDVDQIEQIGQQLFRLVEDERRGRLLISLGKVDRLSTAMVGKFVAAHKKAQALDGRLAFCSIDPPIRQVFELLRLNELFAIYDDEQQGIDGLRKK